MSNIYTDPRDGAVVAVHVKSRSGRLRCEGDLETTGIDVKLLPSYRAVGGVTHVLWVHLDTDEVFAASVDDLNAAELPSRGSGSDRVWFSKEVLRDRCLEGTVADCWESSPVWLREWLRRLDPKMRSWSDNYARAKFESAGAA